MWRYPNLPVMRLCVEGRATGVRVFHAASFSSRLFGLLGRRQLETAEGLWIQPCTSVHTLGMRYPIDVALIDRAGRVVATRSALAPGRLAAARHARCAIELPPHSLAQLGIAPGTRLSMEAI